MVVFVMEMHPRLHKAPRTGDGWDKVGKDDNSTDHVL